MIDLKIQELEIELLLKAIDEIYGISFDNYRHAYITRRIVRRVELSGLKSITMLTNEVVHNTDVSRQLLKDLTINVTDMFRCPGFFKKLKDEVFPILQTYPSIKIWHAGCATGQEVLSLAILLRESNLLHKCKIIASDISQEAMDIAKTGIYPVSKIKEWTESYYKAGGEESFTKYYDVKYQQAKFDMSLLEKVEFINHNLVDDEYPKDLHLILCRNVFIYFTPELQLKCSIKFHNSLVNKGFLGLGYKETLKTSAKAIFTPVSKEFRIYQKDYDR